MHGKLKRIRTNFQGQDIPYDKYCNATAVLKIKSVLYKTILRLSYLFQISWADCNKFRLLLRESLLI